jgi:hypothetical protein
VNVYHGKNIFIHQLEDATLADQEQDGSNNFSSLGMGFKAQSLLRKKKKMNILKGIYARKNMSKHKKYYPLTIKSFKLNISIFTRNLVEWAGIESNSELIFPMR